MAFARLCRLHSKNFSNFFTFSNFSTFFNF